LTKILIIEDEENIRQLIRYNLEKENFEVVEAADGNKGLALAKSMKPELILLDLMLPGMDGLEICRLLKSRQETTAIPIIMLTAKAEEVDKVLGLELGADDYVTKPFSPRELVARVKAVMRRSKREPALPEELAVGRLKFYFDRYEACIDDKHLELTPKEYELVKLLALNLGKVFTREQLLEEVWGYEYFGDTRTVDVHVRHLRMKLAPAPEIVDALETIRGFGYRLREPE